MEKLTFWYFFFNLLSLKLLTSSNFNYLFKNLPLLNLLLEFMCFLFYSIPTIVNGDGAKYATEIYLEEANGFTQKLVTSRFDTTELGTLLTSGTYLSAHFSVDPYDYQRNAGIRLVAEKLIIHSV